MGGGKSKIQTIESQRNDARDQRNVAYNQMTDAKNKYDTTVNNETRKDNQIISDNRAEVRIAGEQNVQNILRQSIIDSTQHAKTTMERLNNGFTSYLSEKNKFLNNQNDTLKITFRNLLNKTNDEIDNLIKNVTNQNRQLELQIKDNDSKENRSKQVKSKFLKIETEKLKRQNQILWYGFYVLLLILTFLMFFFNTFSIFVQTIIFHVLLVYPFLIYYSELLFYIIYSYSKSFFESSKFQHVYLGEY